MEIKSDKELLISAHGGFRNLKSFQLAQLVYDMTVRFCDRYISIKSRTHDQMVQAARSGVQNIAEGSQCTGTSKKFELKLTSVARASLEELKLDYEDFLRHRGLPFWERENPLRQQLIDRRFATVDEVAAWIKEVHDREGNGQNGQRGQSIRKGQSGSVGSLSTMSTSSTSLTYPAIAANAALVLLTVACYLLDRQLAGLAEKFEEEGGFTERLHRVRTGKKSEKLKEKSRRNIQ